VCVGNSNASPGLFPLTEPWTARRAARLDSQSLGQWLRSVRAGATTSDLLAIMARVTWGCEPDDVSMLHAARYARAAGGLDRMLDVENGAQQDRFAAGTQQIAAAAAAELGDRVRIGSRRAAHRLSRRRRNGHQRKGHGRTPNTSLSLSPPEHWSIIEFTPALPAEHRQLPAQWPQGRLSKAYVAYPTPFWRSAGFSGEALSDEGPVFITFDVSPQPDGPGILLGFVDARKFDELPADQRRQRALECFAALFGDEALKPIDYVDHRWGAEEFAPGGPTARGAARLVDALRAVAAASGRAHPLGRHRDRRRVDRLPGRGGAFRSAGRRRSRLSLMSAATS